jgi:hypothetical protein
MRCAALLAPPELEETYRDTARPRLARSAPPDFANRVKLLRAAENRVGSADGGIGGLVGGAGGATGGAVFSCLPGKPGAGGTGGGDGAGGTVGGDSSGPSHEGMSGVPPFGPPYAVEVPT